jgi:hypothetical protein
MDGQPRPGLIVNTFTPTQTKPKQKAVKKICKHFSPNGVRMAT